MSRADLLRCRYNLRLQDTASMLLSWKPFGVTPKTAIEPDLWPWLERHTTRMYVHWVWWIQDTGRFVEVKPQSVYLDTGIDSNGVLGPSTSISPSVEPSREATLQMISFCIDDASGDRDGAVWIIPGATEHPWLEGWRG